MSDPDVLACMDNYHMRLIASAQMKVKGNSLNIKDFRYGGIHHSRW